MKNNNLCYSHSTNLDIFYLSKPNSHIQNKFSNEQNIDKITREEDVKIKISYGNDYYVANNIWENIHFMITEEMITTGKNITENIDETKYYNR